MGDIMEAKTPLEAQATNIRTRYLTELREPYMATYVHTEDKRPRTDGQWQRDYARIMYSSSFRRLQGKMQLLGIKNDQFFRNRLTHSLEVSQIARSIANMIGYADEQSYVVEAGSLAHDLGNPPFGHSGERFLNKWYADIGGFEGNAQTLRILTNIEKKRPEFRGLNLTYRTLLSVVKYYKRFDGELKGAAFEKQKFIYDNDYAMLEEFTEANKIKLRTLDVQIVDIADEMAYAAHDLEDGLRIKAFTIDEILHDYKLTYSDSDCYKKFVKVVDEAKKRAGYGEYKQDSTQYSKLFRQELTSALINLFINDIGLIQVTDAQRKKTGTKNDEELGFTTYGELVKGLKKIVFQGINHNDEVYSYEQGGDRVLEFLCDYFHDNERYLPPEYRVEILIKQNNGLAVEDESTLKKRLVCDYIAGMMDSYAISTYEKVTGKRFMDVYY